MPSQTNESNFDLERSSPYDLSTYTGRVRHFINITSPRTLFATENELGAATSLLANIKENRNIPKDTSINDYWKAKTCNK
ncbi:hypothetical protein HMI55_000674 [Coelomomyces lativittatus]|nr:hypothetical protein HMI55_000674 [Coelomomyces lativittatus]